MYDYFMQASAIVSIVNHFITSTYCKIPSIRSRLQIRLTNIEPVTDSN
jgi:hypothetical protein